MYLRENVFWNWGPGLTTPFCTENPSWYLVSGLFILTSTTGAQETAVSLTAVLFLVFCNGEVFRGIDERDGDRLARGKTRSGAVRRKAMLSELSLRACMCAKTTLSRGEGARAQISVHFLIIPKKQRLQHRVVNSERWTLCGRNRVTDKYAP